MYRSKWWRHDNVINNGDVPRVGFDAKANLNLTINSFMLGVGSSGMRVDLPISSRSGAPTHKTWTWSGI